jgi:hypothetical protein
MWPGCMSIYSGIPLYHGGDRFLDNRLEGLLEVVWVYLDHFRAPAICRSGLSGAGIPRLAVRMHVAG